MHHRFKEIGSCLIDLQIIVVVEVSCRHQQIQTVNGIGLESTSDHGIRLQKNQSNNSSLVS